MSDQYGNQVSGVNMTSHEASQVLRRIVGIFEDKPSLSELLSLCSRISAIIHDEFDQNLITAGVTPNRGDPFVNIKSRINGEFSSSLRRPRVRTIFNELVRLSEQLEAIRAVWQGEEHSVVGLVLADVKQFGDVYEEFIHDPTFDVTYTLINLGEKIERAIFELSLFSRELVDVLEPFDPIIDPDIEELSLQLHSSDIYSEVLNKLRSIEELYSELCTLLGVSTSQYPLHIIKVEWGSLWLRIFGESRVMKLLTDFIEGGAGYLYRKYTTEGKVSAIPRQVESIESVLKLSESLERQGVDTSQIKENLQKSAVIISSRLNDLLAGSPSVEINERVFSVGEALTEKYLAESRTLLLSEGGDATEQ